MAVRRRAWEAVQFEVNNNDMQVHEDQDVSLCMAAKGLKIEQHNDLLMHTMGQTYHYFPKVIHYWRLERSTIAHHKNKGTFSSTMYPRIPRSETVWGRVLALVIGLPVFAISLPLWPIDEIMIKLGKQKTWLD